MGATIRPHRLDRPGRTRRPEIDALRVFSMIAVVGLHAATAYTDFRIPSCSGSSASRAARRGSTGSRCRAVGATMPVFFALAGYAAAAIFGDLGGRGFARDRVRRIGGPFAVAVPTVVLPTTAVWLLGGFISGRTNLRQIGRLLFVDPQIRANRYGPAHLWFLEYLALMLVAYGIGRAIGRRLERIPRFRGAWLVGPLAPLALAVPTTLILWLGHARSGLDPVFDLRNSFAINPTRWLHHALLPGRGLLAARRDGLPRIGQGAWPIALLAASGAALWMRWGLVHRDLIAPLRGSSAWLSAASGAVFGWATLYGLLGLFWRLGMGSGRAWRWLAGSSFWVYLVHFPIVGLVQLDLYRRRSRPARSSRSPGGLAWHGAWARG